MLTSEQAGNLIRAIENGTVVAHVESLLAEARAEEREACAKAKMCETRLHAKCKRQRTELRRLNKYLGPYWAGFHKGINGEAEAKLRGIMNAAFGHKAVHEAEHAAIDKARKDAT